MLALRCFACFQALMKNCRPKTSTTGVASSHMVKLAQGSCIRNIPMTTSGTLSTMDAIRRCFRVRMRTRWSSSRSVVPLCSASITRS